MQQEKKGSEDSKQGIQVIARSADILRMLGENPQGLSLAEIAKGVGLPRSTVQRIVCALQAEYIVEPLGSGGGVRLGSAIGKLFHQTHMDIIHIARPYLESLSEEFSETVYLATRVDKQTCVIDRVIAERPLRVVFPVGDGAPVYNTAAGKSLLAEMPIEEREALLSGGIPVYTERSPNKGELLAQLEEVYRTGIARDIDEYELGVSALGVSLKTYLGVFSAGIAMPTARLPGALDEMESALLRFKREIEARIGLSSLSVG
ncbi:IclR family transcriptional regulator [Aestuariicella hydrocarbonica]|uniref:IclR family transcriptional regulator n=1 Tax=Pseudomaricurvus hydrocarbonicus TaxID=1470433 RepID=A0A9E5JTY6_9GAMM|nr:IclR family transcriptional regulator [Aestuariicella hydrocarbonica]NHO65533.1 IclR family transcriptional regulator [Aestuariicella hydrocarbonica]